MECLQKPNWNEFHREELERIVISMPDETIRRRVREHWDSIAKPLDGLGTLERITAQIGAVLGSDELDIRKKAVLVLCADNGIVEEQVSQSGQEVTARVAEQMARGASSVCKMAKKAHADVIPVDIGINQKNRIFGVMDKKIRCGTRNFAEEPAMTEQETVRAIAIGMELVRQCKENGYQLLATGEMGIGNTTTSSAVIASLLHCPVEAVTGRGAGLCDEKLARKKQVIEEAIQRWKLWDANALTVLSHVGGLDLAGLVGVCIGGAYYRIPIVLDGVISLAAALTAERLVSGTKASLIASHRGKEPAMPLLLKELSLDAVIEAELALGEGTGAVMMMALLELALSVYERRTTFLDMKLCPYERYEQI